jgi:hypothetical protein
MNIQTVKSFLYNKATSFVNKVKEPAIVMADAVGLGMGGSAYMYGIRPAIVGLHGYLLTKNNVQNIFYNSLSMPCGEIINSLPPVKKAINFASRLTARATHFVTKKICPSIIPPRLLPILAGSFVQFRANHFLRIVLPYKIASHFTAIQSKPGMAPGKFETFIWLLMTLLSMMPQEPEKSSSNSSPNMVTPANKLKAAPASGLSKEERMHAIKTGLQESRLHRWKRS